MSKMKMFLLLPVLAIALMGQACPAQDKQVRSLLSAVCPAIEVAYDHYIAIATTGVISASIRNNIELGKQKSDRFCASPQTATTTSVLANAAMVYNEVRKALAEARLAGVEVAKVDRLERSVEAIRSKVLSPRAQ